MGPFKRDGLVAVPALPPGSVSNPCAKYLRMIRKPARRSAMSRRFAEVRPIGQVMKI